MAESVSKNGKPFTHTVWMFKTESMMKGRRKGRWIEEGVARLEANGDLNVYVHSTPIGGFGGHIYLSKIGTAPPDAEPAPQRPGEANDDEASED